MHIVYSYYIIVCLFKQLLGNVYLIIIFLILYSYVDFTYSLTCNGSNTVSSKLTEGSVMLQYRTSVDWFTTNSGK